MAELKDVLTPKQVADYLQMHPITIYRYINEGRIAAAKIGGRYRIRREAVDRFLNDREQETAASIVDDAAEAVRSPTVAEAVRGPIVRDAAEGQA